MKSIKLLKKFFTSIFSIGLILPLTSCSTVNENELYDKNYYYSTPYSDLIKQRSLQLKFIFSNQIISGTGWVWSKNGDYYYVATNLHVASSITYAGNIFLNGNNQKQDYSKVKEFKSEINYATPSNAIASDVVVANPTLIYSTLMDNEYDQTLNGDAPQYYLFNNSFYGVTDICILRYYFPTNEQDFSEEIISNQSNYNNFIRDWINNFDENQIKIYDGNEIDLSKYVFYSGGFPKNEFNNIEWKPVSGFNFNKKITQYFSPSYTTLSQPDNSLGNSSALITFVDSNYRQNKEITNHNYSEHSWYTNYLNISYTGYFYGHSDEGASGSMLTVEINNQLYIVGIYWGVSDFEVGNEYRELGSFDIFISQKYNIVKGINNSISNDINSLEINQES